MHAWVLMGNHYHLVLETPEPNLVTGMQWLQNAYTRRFNTRHRLWGRLFGDRYKAVLVEGAGYYYETLLDYVHLNPVRAGLVKAHQGQSVLGYPWSSAPGGHALAPRRRPAWLAAKEALEAFGFADTASGRRHWVERLDERARNEQRERCGVPTTEGDRDARRSDLRRGWYWGSEAFAERMLQWGEKLLRQPRHRDSTASLEKRAHGEQEARRLLVTGLAAAGLAATELARLPGSDPRKVAIASIIREQTTVNMPWLAAQLHLRSPANASQQIRRYRQQSPLLSPSLQQWVRQSRNVA